ncbi:Card1-like endonuclease domain-containing protein [Beggiatoa leptomitoformis]|uniref:DUF1887 family protein n=1 Tax=Beggiatoa leptomitoformis TaxID=288004 RepID=A0A2N9YF95_9GAMM|nr:DUF1887 family CARF protein [Beggiatoa leptomitoformis]ALG68615.1 DUF1887 family protein [Beggiatoa leptomitoformis]AUI69039.1 DUF1887 family protein [Beggiatoa leptomitoformis]
MAILRCASCGYLREVANQHIARTVACPLCKKTAQVHDTIVLIQKLTDKNKELKQIALTARAKAAETIAATKPQSNNIGALFNTFNNGESAQLKSPKPTSTAQALDKGYAFSHKNDFPFENDLDSLQNWFKSRQIALTLDDQLMDISGYFDEVAVELGDNYALLNKLIASIKRLQTKENARLCFHFGHYSEVEIKKLKDFIQLLYKCAFITRYNIDNKTKDRVYLSLQPARKIVNFFNGDWLEWYIFMKVTSLLWEKRVKFGYFRGGKISFPDNERNEIDLFFLIQGSIPLWIECKSGEFRDSLYKYQQLRKRLRLTHSESILFVLGISNEEAESLSRSFDMTIVNETLFLAALSKMMGVGITQSTKIA